MVGEREEILKAIAWILLLSLLFIQKAKAEDMPILYIDFYIPYVISSPTALGEGPEIVIPE